MVAACVTESISVRKLLYSHKHKRRAAGPLFLAPELGAYRNHSVEETLTAGLTTISEGNRVLDLSALVVRVENVLEIFHVSSVVLWRRGSEG